MRCSPIKQAVVLVREEEGGDKRLVAYYTLKERIEEEDGEEAEEINVERIRTHLKRVLPEYMVPAAFVKLESLPLTLNGKLDRKMLPTPNEGSLAMSEYVPPRNDTQRRLCEIWSQVLGLQRVGIEDNFFALGGDSIRCLQVVSSAWAVSIPIDVIDLFRHPTIAGLATTISERESPQSDSKRIGDFELLTEAECVGLRSIAGSIIDAYPLSALQQGMYFHSEVAPQSAVYHDIIGLRVDIVFRGDLFQRALEDVTQRHTILRTSFVTGVEHRLLQVVHELVTPDVYLEDVSHLSSSDRDKVIRSYIAHEKHVQFTWSEPPLWRVAVHILASSQFHLALSFHHAILDGWSVASLQTELLRNYSKLLNGKDLDTQKPMSLYRDYIALERQTLKSGPAREYWRKLLQGANLDRALRRQPHQAIYNGRKVENYPVVLEPRLGKRLEQCARSLGVGLRSLVLAAHAKVMCFAHGERDLVIGVISHGRLEKEGGDRVLGLHLNSLPLRVALPDGSWGDLILGLRDQEERMWPHRRYPLASIQTLVGSKDLFDTLFNFVRFHIYRQMHESCAVSGGESFEQTNFGLVTNVFQDISGPEFYISLTFDPTVFSRERIERIGDYYTRALEAIAADVDASHDARTLLSEAEREQVLVKWNATQAEYPTDKCVHELFEEQVRRSPAATAVIYEDRSLSYAQLNEQANRLAHHLMEAGVGPDSRVGICLERSLEMVVGLLAILKAGGAYVPLDPSYPSQRLAYLLNDSQPVLLLADDAGLESLSGSALSVPMIHLHADAHRWARCPAGDLRVRGLTPRHLAYIIYTSGSTGEPKGVMVEHRSVCNLKKAGLRV